MRTAACIIPDAWRGADCDLDPGLPRRRRVLIGLSERVHSPVITWSHPTSLPTEDMGDATTVSALEQALVSPTAGFGTTNKGIDVIGDMPPLKMPGCESARDSGPSKSQGWRGGGPPGTHGSLQQTWMRG
jgi:hypothetical protein